MINLAIGSYILIFLSLAMAKAFSLAAILKLQMLKINNPYIADVVRSWQSVSFKVPESQFENQII